MYAWMSNFFFFLSLPLIMELSATKKTMYLSYNNRKKILLTFPQDIFSAFCWLSQNRVRLNFFFTGSASSSCWIILRRVIFSLTIYCLTNLFYLFLIIVCLCAPKLGWFQSSMLRLHDVVLRSSIDQCFLSLFSSLMYTLYIGPGASTSTHLIRWWHPTIMIDWFHHTIIRTLLISDSHRNRKHKS